MRLLILSLLVAVAHGFIGNGISHHIILVTAAVEAASFAQAVTIEETVKKLEDEHRHEVNFAGSPPKGRIIYTHKLRVSVHDTYVNIHVAHKMDSKKPHWIEYIWLTDVKTGAVVAAQAYEPTDEEQPRLQAQVPLGSKVKPYAYCNLHGLWEGEAIRIGKAIKIKSVEPPKQYQPDHKEL
jgi:desulfoferrodoxin (superoxide reductase-like protein)